MKLLGSVTDVLSRVRARQLPEWESSCSSGTVLDSRAQELGGPLQCWEVRPSAAGHSPTIKDSDAAPVPTAKTFSSDQLGSLVFFGSWVQTDLEPPAGNWPGNGGWLRRRRGIASPLTGPQRVQPLRFPKQAGENGRKDNLPVIARVDDDIRCDQGGEQRRQQASHR